MRPLFGRRRRDRELEEEIRSHFEMAIRERIERGESPEEARHAVRREFGNEGLVRETTREMWGWVWLENLFADARHGVRMLRKSPSFTAVAVATLAVAICANAIAFAALNVVILRPIHVPQPRSLYVLQPRANDTSLHESYPDYIDLRDRNTSFDGLAAFSIARAGLNSGLNPSPVWLDEVSANYFDVLRIHPLVGRFFHASEEHGANSMPDAVVSYAFWQTHFHGDRGVVGRTILLNKHPLTVIGVAPPGFHGTILFFSPQIFVPLVDEAQFEGTDNLHARADPSLFVGAMGHLKKGMSPSAAIADLNSIGSFLNKTYPQQERPYNFALKRAGFYGDFLGRPLRAFVTALMLLAGLILVAACLNLGSLFAARARDRSREIALRLALGAGRLRVMRQLFAEAILISLAGGAIGFWGSTMLLQWLRNWQPFPQFPINVPVSPDDRVYLFALLLALASGFLFGTGAVWQVLRTDPYQVVKAGSSAKTGRHRITGRELLLGAQVAVCAVLITASLVAVRGFERSMQSNLGFKPQDAMLVVTELRMAGYSNQQAPAIQKRMVGAIGAVPGVKSVGLVNWAPLGMEGWKEERVFRDNTGDLRPSNAAADATMLKVSPGYFRAAGTTLLFGRDVAWRDDRNAPRVAVVNEEFARELFGTVKNAVGRHYKMQDGTRVEVVGVVENGKFNSLNERQQPAIFLPLLQWPSTGTWMVVRSSRSPRDLATAIRSRLQELDPGLPLFIEMWTKALDGDLFAARVAVVALGILGLMGGILSVTGVFGMATYSVSKRKRELGIRIALGAGPGEVLRSALGRALRLLALGSALGLLLGIFASRVLASIVYRASPLDPVVLTGAVLAMLCVGVLATWIPAQRALSLDPLMLMREE